MSWVNVITPRLPCTLPQLSTALEVTVYRLCTVGVNGKDQELVPAALIHVTSAAQDTPL
jgi:hypothetical protein